MERILTKDEIIEILESYEFECFFTQTGFASYLDKDFILNFKTTFLFPKLFKNRGKQFWRLCTRENVEKILDISKTEDGEKFIDFGVDDPLWKKDPEFYKKMIGH